MKIVILDLNSVLPPKARYGLVITVRFDSPAFLQSCYLAIRSVLTNDGKVRVTPAFFAAQPLETTNHDGPSSHNQYYTNFYNPHRRTTEEASQLLL
jgi:hypothetical protein